VPNPGIRAVPGTRLIAAMGIGTLEGGLTLLAMQAGRGEITDASSQQELSTLVRRLKTGVHTL